MAAKEFIMRAKQMGLQRERVGQYKMIVGKDKIPSA
ncbi:uncharacterized protein G2W53_023434 [Senna tora]|uniref:Uncharacterized protein n=1 Tax=Senna tora TaxID=362788 RepID=A0A834TID1_9FABA|nr:uncharacterized protein G2W53_023434 [Senna tora]